MKKWLAVILSVCLLFTAVSSPVHVFAEEPTFSGMDDPALRDYITDTLYETLLDGLDSTQYAVTDIQAVYISQEYLEEFAYNSQANIFFGFTLAELDSYFSGSKYVFFPDSGETAVKEMQIIHDDTYDRIIRNVVIGTGVILVCVTVTAITAGAGAPAVTMLFSVAADTAVTCSIAGAKFGAVSAAVVAGIQTGDLNYALKQAALSGSEGFKWGAITGAVAGAAAEATGLYKVAHAANSQLTMNQVAQIQMESKLPLEFIKYFHSMEEYQLYQQYGLEAVRVNGELAYVQHINWDLTDEFGNTNVQRVLNGNAPVDSNGIPYELHHIGQADDSPLAILTKSQHMSGGANSILHFNTGKEESEIVRSSFEKIKDSFWSEFMEIDMR